MWQQSENGRVVHPFEPAILAATLALIPVLIIERDVSSGAWVTVAKVANWAIWGIFAAELIFILVVAPTKDAERRKTSQVNGREHLASDARCNETSRQGEPDHYLAVFDARP